MVTENGDIATVSTYCNVHAATEKYKTAVVRSLGPREAGDTRPVNICPRFSQVFQLVCDPEFDS
jgi:hypothetical protein